MATAVRYIRAVGIHGRYDLELEFYPDVNILYGKNGTGKTTLLHILANILNGDFERFAFLPFETIEVLLDDNRQIKLREYTHRENNKIDVYSNNKEIASFSASEAKEKLRQKSSPARKPILPTAYFPAFRTLIEASGPEEETTLFPRTYDEGVRRIPVTIYETELRRQVRYFEEATVLWPSSITSTGFARRFFGDFVPLLNYPSPEEVSRRLSAEMQKALNDIAATDRQLLSKAFLDIFTTLSKESNPDVTQVEQVLKEIQTLLENTSIINDPTIGEEVYSQLRELVPDFKVRLGKEETYVPILEVYKNSLEERAKVQEKSLKVINTYLNSVNRFLDDKQLILRKELPSALPTLLVKFHDANLSKMQALSSGERQIVTLLYSVTHMSGQRVVLIDEPEISLHIDWQRLLIPEMATQLQDLQIITCTHSPMIASKYEDQMIKLEIKPTGRNGAHDNEDKEEVAEEEL